MFRLVLAVLISFLVGSVDDDQVLEFYWSAASGDVDHYNVYVSIDQGAFLLVGEAAVAPVSGSPYALPVVGRVGQSYRVRVQAVDASGSSGPMSEVSDPVLVVPPAAPVGR